MNDLTEQDFVHPLLLSLRVSLFSSVLVFVLGIVVAWWMIGAKFRGKTLLETSFMLPLVLSPTVVGFLLLVLLGRKSWIGRAAEFILHHPIVFTWWAAVIASVTVSFPLVYQTMKTGFLSIEKELRDSARSQGANEWQVLLHITLPLAWRSLVTAFVMGFARSLGEFGATLMLAGNIPGKTQTVPTAIYLAVDSGNMTLAWSLTAATIAISFLLLLFTGKIKVQS